MLERGGTPTSGYAKDGVITSPYGFLVVKLLRSTGVEKLR
jgi:hypothetical protein